MRIETEFINYNICSIFQLRTTTELRELNLIKINSEMTGRMIMNLY